MKKINIYYDGHCPFCKSYVKLQRLRESYLVNLIDLRESPQKVLEFTEVGYDLDEGMVVEVEEKVYCGSEAVYMMSLLQNNSILGVLWKAIFFNKTLTSIFYPVLVFFRNSTLFILGRSKINNK